MGATKTTPDLQWPTITNQCRPWTRWWWLGSAVNEAEITRHLQLFKEAGFGGVEISPIYGVEGTEAQQIPFLSPRWIELLRYTLREAQRLHMGVDIIQGTGWPLGGPWVDAADAASKVLFDVYSLADGEHLEQPLVSHSEPQATLQLLMAFGLAGQVLDLGAHVDLQRRLHWSAPPGQWILYALFQTGTGQQVKRAAPGAEGHVVDHFSGAAIRRYLAHFDQLSAALASDEHIRCFFNDSYEVYKANWTGELVSEFQQRRGYDLRRYLPALCGQGDPQQVARVRSDYRQTIADLLLENFVQPWTAWAYQHGALTRNQAHGSPGNLLDLYAAADIPETETFGTDWLALAQLAPLPGTPPNYGGRADILVGKLASSAAHVSGKPLCSCEAFTWLGEHGKVPLAQMKAELDVAFVMGINHVFFHGTPFSPVDTPWPGWMFYAATHVAPTDPQWDNLSTLNAYISRCQAFLQAGQPANDILVYLPIWDLWAQEQGSQHWLHYLSVHSEHWLDENLSAITVVARQLWERGYSFDFVSDQLLDQAIQNSGQELQSGGSRYKALVVAGCTLMPPATLQRISQLAEGGATVLVVGGLPQDVPGLGNLAERQQLLHAALAKLDVPQLRDAGPTDVHVGRGRLLIGADIELLLQLTRVQRESVVDLGIELMRRRDERGYQYFLTNLGPQQVDQWVSLAVQAAAVIILDPLNNTHGVARTRTRSDGTTDVYLQLAPGESTLVRTLVQTTNELPWPYLAADGEPYLLAGPWHVEFVAGGPTLPNPASIDQLASWTTWPDDQAALQAFSGTARYTLTFELPTVSTAAWALDLGIVCHSARIRLNGEELGVLFAPPFRLGLPQQLLSSVNHLEIEVTNLMANRLADLDRRGEPWKQFFFVNIKYEAFDAAAWEPLSSGLIGPVQLLPFRNLDQAPPDETLTGRPLRADS